MPPRCAQAKTSSVIRLNAPDPPSVEKLTHATHRFSKPVRSANGRCQPACFSRFCKTRRVARARRCRPELGGSSARDDGRLARRRRALAGDSAASGSAACEQALAALRRPEGRLYTYLAREVFASEPPAVRQLLRQLAPLERFPTALGDELGPPGALAGLGRRGLAVRAGDGESALHALLRDYVMESWPLDRSEEREMRCRAARWLSEHGRCIDALPHLAAAGEFAELARALSRSGANC